MITTDHTSDPMADHWEALTQAIRAERDAHRKRAEHAEACATAAEVASRGYRERAEKAERERDAALRTMDEHRCDGQAERAYKRAIHAEAERDALAERAEAAEAKAARFAGLLGHQSRTLTDTIAAEVLRQKADAWDEGYTSGHSRAMRRMSDGPNVEPGTNPYRATTPPTTTDMSDRIDHTSDPMGREYSDPGE